MAKKKQKKDHKRSSLSRLQGVRDIKQSFLIICEGEKTEPDYFKSFRMTSATIKVAGQAMNTIALLIRLSASAMTKCKRNVTMISVG